MKRNWIDNVIHVAIVLMLLVIFWIMFAIVSDAGEPVFVTYQQAGCNMTVYCLKNAEAYMACLDEFDRNLESSRYKETIDEIEARAKKLEKKLAEEERVRETNNKLRAIFGYVPPSWEIGLLKQFVQAECGNTEPPLGIERVTEVIANRVRSSRFPNTISGVLFQRGQFETYSNGSYQCIPNERVKAAWDRILARGYCMDKNVLFFTAGGYNRYCRPGYVIHNHYFGY